MISSFGPNATAYARRLGEMDAIIADPEFIGVAYREAVRRLELGQSFYGLVCIDDPRVSFGYRHGAEILAQLPDYDLRRTVMDELTSGKLLINGKPADTVWPLEPAFTHVSTEFLWLCDALLVRSFVEYARIAEWFASGGILRPLRPVERVLARTEIPVVARVRPERPCVIVWAPARPALHTALHVHGLAEFHGDLVCVTAGGPLPANTCARFLSPGDPELETALSVAAAVVCVEPTDPSDAVAFARLEYGVVAPRTSGANEFASDIVTWDALDPRFLFTAVAVAVTRPATLENEPSQPPPIPVHAGRPAFVNSADLPLVSIITPTYNRPDDLRKMLTCLAAQTYPNFESIVVNDGGLAVDDVVADFPFARLINKLQNAGGLRATLTGWENARGEYIGLLPDDDWLYPSHIDNLMNAMFRSGAKLAHAAGLLRYFERDKNGQWMTTGFNATTFCQTVIPSDALVSTTIGGHQALIHRSVYEEFGWYLLDNELADNEIHIRISHKYFYAYDDHITTEFRDHASGQGRKWDYPALLRLIYNDVHPVTNRPIIEQFRELTLKKMGERDPDKPPFTATVSIVQ